MDSLRYWAEEMHVDGFRFDLAAALARQLHDVDQLSSFFTLIHDSPTLLSKQGTSPGTNTPRDPGGACTGDGDCNDGAVCGASGQCVCLHNGWKRASEDDSSKSTSSSVFDFNGDGAAEVVYNDECVLRIYEGRTGELLTWHESLSRTVVENPVVADVDNDGNAEIITIMNTETMQCGSDNIDGVPGAEIDRDNADTGIRVWGDPADTWVSARRIWNQQSYHVTNVTEAGGIPLRQPESWLEYNGRYYNTYRSQPRSEGVAPDLTVSGIGVSLPGAGCGDGLATLVDIAFEVRNLGDLRIGPGVEVALFGVWDDEDLDEALHADGAGTPLTTVLQVSLEPGASIVLTLPYDATNNSPLRIPDEVRVVVDSADAERECNEDNNALTEVIDTAAALPDLSIEIDAVGTCPSPTVSFTVHNDGVQSAENFVVRFYAGDPSQGGTPLGETTIAGPLAGGESTSGEVELEDFPKNRTIFIYAVVDPADNIEECNNANNKTVADEALRCNSTVQ
jgi:hypothetical protein